MVKSSAGLTRSQIENLNAAVDLGSDKNRPGGEDEAGPEEDPSQVY